MSTYRFSSLVYIYKYSIYFFLKYNIGDTVCGERNLVQLRGSMKSFFFGKISLYLRYPTEKIKPTSEVFRKNQ